MLRQHFFIVGPTASGKSSLAIALAQRLGCEIASVDAFQIYRGMDVGTGKVTAGEMQDVRHHLLDIADPNVEFSVADYVDAAREVIAGVQQPMIWVGGTGLYVSALLNGLAPAPATPDEIQHELNQRSLVSLREEIEQVDPEWSAQADLNNHRRIIRALGVYRFTGKTMSEWQREQLPGLLAGAQVFYLCPEAETLRKRINQRVAQMLRDGWLDEVKTLAAQPGWEDSQALRAIGYHDMLRCVRGELSLAECEAEISLRTWQYARRQRTWFRKQHGIISLETNDPVEEILHHRGAA